MFLATTPNLSRFVSVAIAVVFSLVCTPAFAVSTSNTALDLTNHWVGFAALAIFAAAYALVIAEDVLHLRKSKPVMLASGLIWGLLGVVYVQNGMPDVLEVSIRHALTEYVELFLFLLAAMTYINSMEERGVFDWLKGWLVSQGYTLRGIFWLTGLLAFLISPIADNLTTALLMTTVVLAVDSTHKRFTVVACINIVVAANAGGAFSPFGDITTLMVWQSGKVEFQQFFVLFVPSLANWLIPAALMSLTIAKEKPDPLHAPAQVKHGAWAAVVLFLVTIALAAGCHMFLHLPPVLGMMTGLALLKLYGYYLKKVEHVNDMAIADCADGNEQMETMSNEPPADEPFCIFRQVERAEWDTLMFFYGIILCVGGLAQIGYLAMGSDLMYGGYGASVANISVGVFSAIIDNIPVMLAVLTMDPTMSLGQWLLVTLTAGVGGSMLSIGSAAGVAVMGQARGIYTFMGHLKWAWAIAIGYVVSIWLHFQLNGASFDVPI